MCQNHRRWQVLKDLNSKNWFLKRIINVILLGSTQFSWKCNMKVEDGVREELTHFVNKTLISRVKLCTNLHVLLVVVWRKKWTSKGLRCIDDKGKVHLVRPTIDYSTRTLFVDPCRLRETITHHHHPLQTGQRDYQGTKLSFNRVLDTDHTTLRTSTVLCLGESVSLYEF